MAPSYRIDRKSVNQFQNNSIGVDEDAGGKWYKICSKTSPERPLNSYGSKTAIGRSLYGQRSSFIFGKMSSGLMI